MPYTHETRTFKVEIEVTARAHIETGGGYSDEPPWAEIQEIEIDYVEVGGEKIGNLCFRIRDALTNLAYEEFAA